jgi:hypothetical protein
MERGCGGRGYALERSSEIPENIFVAPNQGEIRVVFAPNNLIPNDDLVLYALGVGILGLDVEEQLFSIPVEQGREV